MGEIAEDLVFEGMCQELDDMDFVTLSSSHVEFDFIGPRLSRIPDKLQEWKSKMFEKSTDDNSKSGSKRQYVVYPDDDIDEAFESEETTYSQLCCKASTKCNSSETTNPDTILYINKQITKW